MSVHARNGHEYEHETLHAVISVYLWANANLPCISQCILGYNIEHQHVELLALRLLSIVMLIAL